MSCFIALSSYPLHRMGDFLRSLRITSKALGLPLASFVGACATMSCADMNKFLSACVAFASWF